MGPPQSVVVVAEVTHDCEGQIVAMIKGEAVPLLARMIYTENKQLIGKVDDVFGPMHTPGIAVIPDANSGIKSSSFKAGDKVRQLNSSLFSQRSPFCRITEGFQF